MEKWGSSKLPGRNESAWRAGAQPGRGVARGNEWNARRGRGAPLPQAPGKGTPPPGFDGPPGFPTKPVRSSSTPLHKACLRYTCQEMFYNDHAVHSMSWLGCSNTPGL